MVLKSILMVVAFAALLVLWSFSSAAPGWAILVAAVLVFGIYFSPSLFHLGMFCWNALEKRRERSDVRNQARLFDQMQSASPAGEVPAFLTDPDHEPPMTAA